MLTNRKTILDYAEAALGKDITPNDEYPDEISCAWSLSLLENQLDSSFKRIPGTWTLWSYYDNHPRFKRVNEPQPGTRIICPTTPGHPFPGHCGVFMSDMTIASNDSRTGKFIKNFDAGTWYERYAKKGGYVVYLYDEV